MREVACSIAGGGRERMFSGRKLRIERDGPKVGFASMRVSSSSRSFSVWGLPREVDRSQVTIMGTRMMPPNSWSARFMARVTSESEGRVSVQTISDFSWVALQTKIAVSPSASKVSGRERAVVSRASATSNPCG